MGYCDCDRGQEPSTVIFFFSRCDLVSDPPRTDAAKIFQSYICHSGANNEVQNVTAISETNITVATPSTNSQRIDLALIVQSRDAISPMHCLTRLEILTEL